MKKLEIICAICAGANLGVLAAKISVLRRKLVIIVATRAGVHLGVLAAKICVLRKKIVLICATRAVLGKDFPPRVCFKYRYWFHTLYIYGFQLW